MAPVGGTRVKKIIVENFEPGTATHSNESTGTLRAREAEAQIKRCPTSESPQSPPEVPPRPKQYRTPPQQQEQTPPSSPQEAFHQQREQTSTPTPPRRTERPPTPENSKLSTNFDSISESDASSHDVQAKLAKLEIEVRSLESKLDDRVQAEKSLRNSLDEAIKKYDEAISDLQKSQQEKNKLQDQVDRLRRELSQERADRRALEADIDDRIRRERGLREMLNSLTRIEEALEAGGRRNIEAQEVNHVRLAPSMEEQPKGPRSERRRIRERDESRVSWSQSFSSKERHKVGRAAKGK